MSYHGHDHHQWGMHGWLWLSSHGNCRTFSPFNMEQLAPLPSSKKKYNGKLIFVHEQILYNYITLSRMASKETLIVCTTSQWKTHPKYLHTLSILLGIKKARVLGQKYTMVPILICHKHSNFVEVHVLNINHVKNKINLCDVIAYSCSLYPKDEIDYVKPPYRFIF